jgi:hypothetical protein
MRTVLRLVLLSGLLARAAAFPQSSLIMDGRPPGEVADVVQRVAVRARAGERSRRPGRAAIRIKGLPTGTRRNGRKAARMHHADLQL